MTDGRHDVPDIREWGPDAWRDLCTQIADEVFRQKFEHLTGREEQVARMLVTGWQNADIAKHLGIAEKTTKEHIRQIYKAFSVHSRAEFLGAIFPLDPIEVPSVPRRKWGHGWRARRETPTT